MTDPHTQRACDLFGVVPTAVTKEQRAYAKQCSYIDAYSSPVPLATMFPKAVPHDRASVPVLGGTNCHQLATKLAHLFVFP